MKKIISECVGCETCINCGKSYNTIIICDYCKNEIEDDVYNYNNKDYDKNCLMLILAKEGYTNDDILDIIEDYYI